MCMLIFIILKHASLVPLLIEMAFFQKIIKRRSENKKAKADPKVNTGTKRQERLTTTSYEDSTDIPSTFTTEACLDLTSSDSDSDEDNKKEAMLTEMRRQLKSMK